MKISDCAMYLLLLLLSIAEEKLTKSLHAATNCSFSSWEIESTYCTLVFLDKLIVKTCFLHKGT